jgi:hypothetical protein
VEAAESDAFVKIDLGGASGVAEAAGHEGAGPKSRTIGLDSIRLLLERPHFEPRDSNPSRAFGVKNSALLLDAKGNADCAG